MSLPNLAERVAWYQEHLRPEDPKFGPGIADWTITTEYRPGLVVPGVGNAWGCMCSPAALPAIEPLTDEDVDARRAHIIIRTPETRAHVAQIERTLLHEIGHVLCAPMKPADIDAEENAMHSIDAFFAKLSPAQGRALARAMNDPKALAYRADNGDIMPDDDKKPKDADNGDKKVATQENVRSVAEINEDIVKAVMAGQPTEELVKELVAAQALAGAAAAATPEAPAIPEAPSMGMKPEEAYARARADVQAATKEAVEAIIEANPHLDDKQRVMVRKQGTAAAARELVATYPRPTAQDSAKPRMGLPGHPATTAGGGAAMGVRARARALPAHVDDRETIGVLDPDSDTNGVNLDVPGNVIVLDLGKRHLERRVTARKASGK